jgi:hypothetical protein
MQSSQEFVSDPFLIIHNHRKQFQAGNHPREHKRQPKDYSSLPHSIIMTRKMVAEQELRQLETQQKINESL